MRAAAPAVSQGILKPAMVAVDTGSVFMAYLGLVAVFGAFLGFRESTRYETRTGRRAWGLPAGAWAAIWACSLLVGAVLFSIAAQRRAGDPSFGCTIRVGWIFRSAGIVVGLALGPLLVLGGLTSIFAGEALAPNLVFAVVGAGFFAGGVRLIHSRRPSPTVPS